MLWGLRGWGGGEGPEGGGLAGGEGAEEGVYGSVCVWACRADTHGGYTWA
jgi:hypothetical protein